MKKKKLKSVKWRKTLSRIASARMRIPKYKPRRMTIRIKTS